MSECVSVTREIPASAEAIFELLVDPAKHCLIDGSGMLQNHTFGPSNLQMGSKFGMDMKKGPVPYKITNTVVEFEPNKRIAWSHFNKHRWRYELEPTGPHTTNVTESFDWSTARSKLFLKIINAPSDNAKAIAKTLERLENHFKGV